MQVWNPASHEIVETYSGAAFPLNAIRFQGDLVIAELGTGSVVRVQGEERVILADSNTGIVVPAGLAATEEDLWVSDWATGTVWQLVAGGELLSNRWRSHPGWPFLKVWQWAQMEICWSWKQVPAA